MILSPKTGILLTIACLVRIKHLTLFYDSLTYYGKLLDLPLIIFPLKKALE